MSAHYGTTAHDVDYAVEVTRGVTFRCYDFAKTLEVSVEEGVICAVCLPDEITTGDEARAWAALLMDAADALERGE